jgi:hypothetical protein
MGVLGMHRCKSFLLDGMILGSESGKEENFIPSIEGRAFGRKKQFRHASTLQKFMKGMTEHGGSWLYALLLRRQRWGGSWFDTIGANSE